MSNLRIPLAVMLLLALAVSTAWGTAFFVEGKPGPASPNTIVIPPPKNGAAAAPAIPAVQLSTGAFVPPAGIDQRLARALAPGAEGAEAGRACLLLCKAPAQSPITRDLAALGVPVLGVYPENTYIVRVRAGQLGALADRAYVQWVGMLPAQYKVAPTLEEAVAGQNQYRWRERICAVDIYDPADADLVAARLAAAGMVVENWLPATNTFVCRVQTAAQARGCAEWSEVAFLEPVPVAHPDLATSVALCGHADWVREHTNWGNDGCVGMIDTGFENDHVMFSGVIPPYPALWSSDFNASGDGGGYFVDPSGHGTHMAGIILGRGTTIAGVCPWLCGTEYFRTVRCATVSNPTVLVNVESAMDWLATDYKANTINCSWSNGDNTGLDLTSRTVDDVVWTTHQTYVCSAGNGGTAPGSIAGPGAAKNAIAVGSVSHDSTYTLSYFSGMGPTADSRQKPDVYAPGESIVSADASGYSLYKSITGCSVATAHVTGVLGSLTWFHNEGGSWDMRRLPATVKAGLMATATHKDDLLPTRTGVVNSCELHSINDTSDVTYCWFNSPVDPGTEYMTWEVNVPENVAEMRVVLSWIEPAAPAGASYSCLDDIDLWVDVGADDTNYRGEYYSTSICDTVESVTITNPTPGRYNINARRYSASQPYIPGAAVYVRFADIPAAPTNLAASLAGANVLLTWKDNSTRESGYRVYHRTSTSSPWTQIADVAPDSTSYTHAAPTAGITHYYQVQAYNTNGTTFSNPASIFVPSAGWQTENVNWGVSYGNNWARRGVITKPGATLVRVHFSSLNLGNDADHLTTSSGNDWTTSGTGVTSNAASGSSISLTVNADAATPGSFIIDRVEWQGAASGAAYYDGPLFGLASFDDVPTSASIWSYVEAVYREGITSGCSTSPPRYCPNNSITRGQMAVFICRAAGIEPYNNPTPTFGDVPSSSSQYAYVEALVREGVTSGCSTTPKLYCPNSPVTRGQMAVFLCRAAGLSPYSPVVPTFTDVASTSGIYGYVERVYLEGITSGCSTSPPRYCPDSTVTRGQMAVFLCRAFDIKL